MTGMELSRAFYNEYGADMLKEEFADIEALLAVGLVGSGSECFGYDDRISTDHDFEPGFCIFIPSEELIDSRTEFRLERAYAKLPKEFEGFKRSSISPVGGNRKGVIRISDFYISKCGSPDGKLSGTQWLAAPEYALAEAVNGEVFADNYGLFSEIRNRLSYYPEDVRRKKLAGNLIRMGQAGQYNYNRCISHRETGAAQLAAHEFVQGALHTVFLLNRVYMPYYKWSFRALRGLERLSSLSDSLEYLLSSENDSNTAPVKGEIIEDISGMIIDELKAERLTDAVCYDLEKHAYSVNDRIEDGNIRNMNIFEGI
ncbi:MAG: DUF4037 domain-containing protein [Clostridiales bacterium]|nr:DUF4037 domain-containing protein [Clostridiales bacterium]